MDQIVNSIIKLEENITTLDPKFPIGKSYQIYPCIVFNDKSLQTGLMADTFNNRFNELISVVNTNKVYVRPLCLIHINDFERLEEPLEMNPSLIWEFLRQNHKGRKFIPPFFDTLNRTWKGKEYPKRIMDYYKSLINKFEQKTAGNNS